MQASDVLAAMSLQLQQAAQLQLAAFATQQPALHSAAALSSATSGPMTGVVRAWYEERPPWPHSRVCMRAAGQASATMVTCMTLGGGLGGIDEAARIFF